MTRITPAAVALALIAVAAVRADPIPVPPLPSKATAVTPVSYRQGGDEKGGVAGDKGKPDAKAAPAEQRPEDAPEAHRPPPIRYPLVAYPRVGELAMAVSHDGGLGGCDDDTEFGIAFDLVLDGLERLRAAGGPGADPSRDGGG